MKEGKTYFDYETFQYFTVEEIVQDNLVVKVGEKTDTWSLQITQEDYLNDLIIDVEG